MRHTRRYKIICIFLCAALLCGCSAESGADVQPSPTDGDAAPVISGSQTGSGDGRFTLNYDAGSSLNPVRATNVYNDAIMDLVYEGLFALDAQFEAQPVLCESWTTGDGVHWTFTLKSGVKCHDGTSLTAADVVYSINLASNTARYGARFDGLAGVSAGGALEVDVTLRAANYSLPALLDIPIVKEGTGGDARPAGTGPYVIRESGETLYLEAFAGHRSYETLPVRILYLEEQTQEQLAEAFAGETIDFMPYDPTGTVEMHIRRDCDVRYYDTARLQYIGFNMSDPMMSDAKVRRAISCAVDRAYILETIFENHARSAPLVLSAALTCYDTVWEEGVGYSIQQLSTILAELGLEDSDTDGWLEYPAGSGMADWTLTFLVNEENRFKTASAQRIAYSLRSIGVNVDLQILPWEDYVEALESGSFDMYYGEVQLAPDFDLSPLLGEAGSLNYGGISDTQYDTLIAAFLAAPDTAAKKTAAAALCAYILENTPIVPVVYKMGAVYSHRGAVSPFTPTQSNLFGDIAAWQMG